MRNNKPLSQLTHIVVVSDEDSFGIPAITEFGGAQHTQAGNITLTYRIIRKLIWGYRSTTSR